MHTPGMTPEELATKLLEVAGPTLVTVVGIMLTWLTWRAKAWLDTKISDARVSSVTQRIAHLTENAIAEAEQTTVKKLKADGAKWDESTALAVRDGVVDVVKRHLGTKGMKASRDGLGHDNGVIEGMIRTQIEAHLSKAGK